jgi:hypothetical protein
MIVAPFTIAGGVAGVSHSVFCTTASEMSTAQASTMA